MRRYGGILAALLACAAAMAMAGTAGAQVAIGPALNQPPATAEGCEAPISPLLRANLPPTCTVFAANMQVPRGNWRVTAVSVRTGPRTGPMRVQIVQALRSQAQAPGTPNASGAICCTSPAQSPAFELPPNSTRTVAVDLPVRNTIENIDGEPIEVVDYIGLTLLNRNSSLPAALDTSSSAFVFLPALNRGDPLRILSGAATLPNALPLISAVVCPVNTGASLNAKRSMQAGGCPTVPGTGPQPGPQPQPGSLSGQTLPSRPAALSLAPTLAQIRINQRIAVTAIRRLNAINARLEGRPAPSASGGTPGRIVANTAQLRINQRISEAGYRRAKGIFERLGGSGVASLASVANTVRFTRAGVGLNQLTNIKTLDMLKLINAHMASN